MGVLGLRSIYDRRNKRAIRALERYYEVGIYTPEEKIFIYDEAEHKLFFNSVSRIFGVVKNDRSGSVNFVLSRAPEQDVCLNMEINCEGIHEIESLAGMTLKGMEVIRKSGDRFWLWNREKRIGFIILWLG